MTTATRIAALEAQVTALTQSTAQPSAADIEIIRGFATAALKEGLREALAPLMAHIATLEAEVQRAHARLDKAAEVIKALRERPAPQTQEPRLGKSDLRAWHIALSQLREERGLAPTAFVKRQDILDRIASNKAAA